MAIPVIKVPGIGPKTAEFLEANGITTAETLLDAGLDKLCEAPGFHANRAQAALDAAGELTGTKTSAEKPKKKKAKKPKDKKKDKKKAKKSDKGKKGKKPDKKKSCKKDKKKGKKKK
jgi:hypothetical protein